MDYIRLARDETDAGMERYRQAEADFNQRYEAAWRAISNAKGPEALRAAWDAMLALSDAEAAHLDKVAGWMGDSHERLIGAHLDQKGESSAS